MKQTSKQATVLEEVMSQLVLLSWFRFQIFTKRYIFFRLIVYREALLMFETLL